MILKLKQILLKKIKKVNFWKKYYLIFHLDLTVKEKVSPLFKN
jgi:hypothetical protein